MFDSQAYREEPDRPAVVCFDFGARNKLSRKHASDAAGTFKKLTDQFPDAEFCICIAGYDDDPRGLWEIKEVAAYVRQFMDACDKIMTRNVKINDECKAMIAACLGVAKITPVGTNSFIFEF